MTMKSTLIVSMTLLAALAAGVLVHERLGTKSLVDDAVPTQTTSVATARARRSSACEPAARVDPRARLTRGEPR